MKCSLIPWSYVLSSFLGAMGCVVPAFAQQSGSGEQIFRSECETCHGSEAQGGHGGEYPRLAGLPAGYLQAQLRAFRDRSRQNKPMIPIFEKDGLGDDDIAAVSDFVSSLPAPAIEVDPEQERALLAAIETEEAAEPDLEWGEEIYISDCSLCHGKAGEGKEDTDNPPLASQYPSYLAKQIADFSSGQRWHEFDKALFKERDPEEIQAMLAYLFEIVRRPQGE